MSQLGGGQRCVEPIDPSPRSPVQSVAFLRVWLVLRVEGKLWSGGFLEGAEGLGGQAQ